jgi:hypothetical protein
MSLTNAAVSSSASSRAGGRTSSSDRDRAGQYVAELDAPRSLVKLIHDGEADEEKVIKELSAYRVDVKTEARLVRRRRASGKK